MSRLSSRDLLARRPERAEVSLWWEWERRQSSLRWPGPVPRMVGLAGLRMTLGLDRAPFEPSAQLKH